MARRKLRILLLCHESLVPPEGHARMTRDERQEFLTESDVVQALERLGHDVRVVGLYDDLAPLRTAITEHRPHLAVNLLEEFRGLTIYDHNVVSYLELMRVPYTGCNPRGLVLGRDKALSKKISTYHRIPVPGFAVFRPGRKVERPPRLEFPLIVKSLTEDASAGIAGASVVHSDEKLVERVEFIHRSLGTASIVEQYIDGRELYVGVFGKSRLTVLPVWELFLDRLPESAPRIATRRAKWDRAYQDRHRIMMGPAAAMPEGAEARVQRYARRIYRALNLSGYARLDFRLDETGRPWFLEANPNPELSSDAEFAYSATAVGWTYDRLIARLVAQGLRALEH